MNHGALSEEMSLCRTTQLKRFKGFAVSHFLISVISMVLSICGVLVGLVLKENRIVPVVAVVTLWDIILLASYAIAGAWRAREEGWNRPKLREGLLAFFAPALIAWAWGGCVLLLALLPGPSWPDIMAAMLWVSAFLACPSFCMVLAALLLGALGSMGIVNLLFWLLLAGGVPPLLFLLGSLWGSRGRRKQADLTNSFT